MIMRVPEFVLEGDTLVAMQNARALHRMMGLMRSVGRFMPEFEPIIRALSEGRSGGRSRVFVEEAGRHSPHLSSHAGADSRQYRHLMNDTAVTDRFRVICFDMPWHGRSDPPDKWWLQSYELTTESYLAAIEAYGALLGRRPVPRLLMGGAIVLRIASDFQDEIRGVIGLESALTRRGATTSFCTIPPFTAASLSRPTRGASTRLKAPRQANAPTGGTTPSLDPAFIAGT